MAEEAGADGITAHLREDRRHIADEDIERLMDALECRTTLDVVMTALDKSDDMETVAGFIVDAVKSADDDAALARIKSAVASFASGFHVPGLDDA